MQYTNKCSKQCSRISSPIITILNSSGLDHGLIRGIGQGLFRSWAWWTSGSLGHGLKMSETAQNGSLLTRKKLPELLKKDGEKK